MVSAPAMVREFAAGFTLVWSLLPPIAFDDDDDDDDANDEGLALTGIPGAPPGGAMGCSGGGVGSRTRRGVEEEVEEVEVGRAT